MGLRKEVAQRMRAAGFISRELKEFSSAKKPDGEPQDLDLIVNSAPFEHMLESRRKWMENALKAKPLGGLGLTYKQATQIIEDYYTIKGKRKQGVRSLWSFLKTSYRPKEKIQTKKKFQEAITKKSIIGKTHGSGYGERLKIRYAPRNSTQKCSHCKGSGSLMNLERRRITCIYCNGTGVEGRKFI
jgi:hypothetical protein